MGKTVIQDKIHKINECLVTLGANPDKNINTLVGLCGELLKSDCSLYLHPNGNTLNLQAHWNLPKGFTCRFDTDNNIFNNLIKSKTETIQVINNLSKTSYVKNDVFIKENNFNAFAGVKVKHPDKSPGVLGVFYKKDSSLSEEDKRALDIISLAINVEEQRKFAQKEKELYRIRLIQNEKMAGIGTLASGVAHEFNNMLQIIDGYAKHANKTNKPEDIREALEIILETTAEASKIVKNLLAFSKQDKKEKELCIVSDLADSVLVLMERQFTKRNIEIKRKYEKDQFAFVNKAEMQQAFLHIIMNARDALLPDGGALTVSVKKDHDNIEISFADTGKGIPKEDLPRIFEPFYTTKGSLGEGSVEGRGLGLFVVYGIVQNQGGRIEFASKQGHGSTVRIFLPEVKKDETRSEEGKNEARKKKEILGPGPLNILVVDDEVNIRKLLVKHLEKKGYKVKDSESAKEALKMIKNEIYHIVFLDYIMPGVKGTEVIDEIKTHSPHTKIIISTGIENSEIIKAFKKESQYEFLEKPFTMDEVDEKIKKLTGDTNG
ncbi:MAG: response regulator [Endomicrobiales bacterium]|nr:response regulator [Endomicrobiales bacterium]